MPNKKVGHYEVSMRWLLPFIADH